MKLIVGLGNPGEQYQKTRHNVGFMTVDALAGKLNLSFRFEKKFQGELAMGTIQDEKVFLLKPHTFMNLSGESVKAVLEYYHIPVEDLLVISDDLDSPLGRIRFRAEGSSGGHNGHKNIILHLHTEAYKRLKIGIGRSTAFSMVDWVLQNFTSEETLTISQSISTATEALFEWLSGVPFHKISSLYSTKA